MLIEEMLMLMIFEDAFQFLRESLVHPSSVAALVSVGPRAVDQLLLAERDERVTGAGPSTLQRADGREGPARAALALVLDTGDHSVLTPVHAARHRLAGHLVGLVGSGASHLEALEQTGELLGGEVGEFVERHGEGVLALGVLLHVLLDVRLVVGVHLLEGKGAKRHRSGGWGSCCPK